MYHVQLVRFLGEIRRNTQAKTPRQRGSLRKSYGCNMITEKCLHKRLILQLFENNATF